VASGEQTFLEHLEELRRRLFRIAVGVLLGMAFSFFFGIHEVKISGTRLLLPLPDPDNNLALQLIGRVRRDQLPPGVQLAQLTPGQAFFAQIYVSVFLGVVLSMPLIVHEVAAFLNPALYPHERRMILRLVVPGSLLFLGGAIFSYYTLTPLALRFLYGYGVLIDPKILQVITIDDLLNYVILFSVGSGVAFQLPLIMWLLTRLGVVEADYWRRNIRLAIVAILVFAAMVTPDGTGITMFLLAAPLTLLYVAGYVMARRVRHQKPP
jgi:sec-independent protein translocase protein TatC